MTLEEMFAAEKIEEQHLIDIQDESEYWGRAGSFILDNWSRDYSRLSMSQGQWVDSILDDLIEMRIERKSVFE
jgi:hypothetical protein